MSDTAVSDHDAVTFDHLSPDLAGPAFWVALREVQRRGGLTWVESHGGFWAATSNEMVLRILQDWRTFSSSEGIVFPGRPTPDVMPWVMPLEIDPPRHKTYRKQVNPQLTPDKVAVHGEAIRAIADELIDAFVERGSCDISREFARLFPGTVFFRLIVECGDDDFRAVEPVARVMTFAKDAESRGEASVKLRAWAAKVLDERRHAPGTTVDDVVDAVLHLADTGEPFVAHEYQSGLSILAQGGIGTSASVIASAVWFLANDRPLQERVRRDRSLVPALVEETIRLEPPLPLVFRKVTNDVEVDGKRLQHGDWVGVFVGAANRDPSAFEQPDAFDIDRPHNRHLSFGAGPHRCIGSNLARLQIRIAMEQLVARLSPFWIPEGAVLEYATHQTRAITSMPLEFAPAG
jgi:cytochrome P450